MIHCKGGENIRLGSKLLLILLLFALMLAPISAEDVKDVNSTLEISSLNNIEDANVYDYFDMDNVMTEEFSNATYVFTEKLFDLISMLSTL